MRLPGDASRSWHGTWLTAIGAQVRKGVQGAGNLQGKLELGAEPVHAPYAQTHVVVGGSRVSVRRAGAFGASAVAKIPVILDDRRIIALGLRRNLQRLADSRRAW